MFASEDDMLSFDSDMKLKSFQHYPIKAAEREVREAMSKKVKVTTINWTMANGTTTDIDFDPSKPSPNPNEVHKNEYEFTFGELIEFIQKSYDVAEEVIAIEFL